MTLYNWSALLNKVAKYIIKYSNDVTKSKKRDKGTLWSDTGFARVFPEKKKKMV